MCLHTGFYRNSNDCTSINKVVKNIKIFYPLILTSAKSPDSKPEKSDSSSDSIPSPSHLQTRPMIVKIFFSLKISSKFTFIILPLQLQQAQNSLLLKLSLHSIFPHQPCLFIRHLDIKTLKNQASTIQLFEIPPFHKTFGYLDLPKIVCF